MKKEKIFLVLFLIIIMESLSSCFIDDNISLKPISDESNKTEFVYSLIENNNNCKYPCFWGIIPFETDLDKADKFLSSFSVYNYDKKKYLFINSIETIEELNNAERIILTLFTYENEINHIVVDVNNIKSNKYSIYNILNEYKFPSDVKVEFIQTFPDYWKVYIYIIFSNHSFTAIYNSNSVHINDKNNIYPCFSSDVVFDLWPIEEERAGELVIRESVNAFNFNDVSNFPLINFLEMNENDLGEYCLTLTVPENLLP